MGLLINVKEKYILKKLTCSFCGCKSSDTKRMINASNYSNNGYINVCDSCIKMMYQIVTEAENEEIQNDTEIKKPSEIKAYLDKYIIAQDKAKEQLAVALYEHQKQVKYNSTLNNNQEPITRNNIIAIGSSGVGM